VFIDEAWASTNMARLHGRGRPRVKRLRAGIPQGHWKTTTFVAGLRLTGMMATMVLDGPINREAFQAYVEQLLVRTQARRHRDHGQPCLATRAQPSARPSRRPAPAWSSCRLTALTSIR
jgi:hypothetical protein